MTSLDPVILFFLFGLVAGLLRSELKLPGALYESLSVFLLLAIGLKGGQGLATQPLAPLIPAIGAVILLGAIQTLIGFAALRSLGRFDRPDAAAIAAHYGSVSVATFAVAVAWADDRRLSAPAAAHLALVPDEHRVVVHPVSGRYFLGLDFDQGDAPDFLSLGVSPADQQAVSEYQRFPG